MARLVSLTTLALLTLVAIPVHAAPITFFGLDDPRGTLSNSMQAESDFMAALILFGTETVDGLPDGQNFPTLTFGATGVTAIGSGTQVFADPSAVSSPNLLRGEPLAEVFNFNQPVQAFGTFLVDLGDVSLANTLIFVLENTLLGTSQSVNVGTFGPNATTDNVAYFGIVDAASPFNRVTVQESNPSDFFAYDNLTAGFAPAAVPEPGTLILLATGAVGLLVRRCRHRRF